MTGDVTAPVAGARGQTSVDFVIAIGVFLVVMVAVAGVVPQLFAAFDDSPERPLVAGRAADEVGHGLSTSGEPGVLNGTCAEAFLSQSESACGYDPSNPLTDQLGIGSQYRVNVSLQANRTTDPGLEVLCTDGSTIGTCSDGDDRLAVGPPVPERRSSVDTASRVVSVGGSTATVVVNVW